MGKKYKILVEKKSYEEAEIEFPFYALFEEGIETVFVKITQKELKQITFYRYGKYELFKCPTSRSVSAIWYENKCDWKQWQEAVRSAKSYVQSF